MVDTVLTAQDLCTDALRECGAIGLGQNASGADITTAQLRLQLMLQEWERQRWLVYHIVDFVKTSTGATTYSIGPGGDFDTGTGSVRPSRIESAFARQNNSGIPVDYTLTIIQSYEDYSKLSLKTFKSFPAAVFLDTAWPLGVLKIYPVPLANIYELHMQIREQLPQSFATLATQVVLPYEYYSALLYNLAWRLRSRYQLPTFQGDPLPGLAKASLNVLRKANVQPEELTSNIPRSRPNYNIWSDRSY